MMSGHLIEIRVSQGYVASGHKYTQKYDRIITDVPRKTKYVDNTVS